ncbi:MAG: hypothetical protein AB1324_00480, partial [Candidatus Micrarchaeota archaeon]
MRQLTAVLFILLMAGVAFPLDAVIAYRANDVNQPKLRFWDSSGSGSWGSEIALNGSGGPVRWAVIKSSPISQKLVMVTLSDDGNLDGYACAADCTNTSNWVYSGNIGQVWTISANQRHFDIAFERSSGDAVLVYSILSTNTSRDLAYRVLGAGSLNFSSTTEQYINDAGHGTDIQYTWVRLASDPISASSEISLIAFDGTDADINGWIWDGGAWTNQVEITGDAPSASG